MKLIGKSREEIEQLTEHKTRSELLDILHSLATLEPHFSPGTVANRRGMSRETVIDLCRSGKIRAVHKPLQNSYRIPLSALVAWDQSTRVDFSPNGHK